MSAGLAQPTAARPAGAALASRSRSQAAREPVRRAPEARAPDGARPLPPSTRERLEAAFAVTAEDVRADAEVAEEHDAEAPPVERHLAVVPESAEPAGREAEPAGDAWTMRERIVRRASADTAAGDGDGARGKPGAEPAAPALAPLVEPEADEATGLVAEADTAKQQLAARARRVAPVDESEAESDRSDAAPHPSATPVLRLVPVEDDGPRGAPAGAVEAVARGPPPPARAAIVQTKLAVSSPGDPLEREADGVAARVLRGDAPAPLLRGLPPLPARGPPGEVAAVLAAPGSGSPLDGALRARIEPHLGVDLGDVRVRRDADAAAAARALHARAFASGSTIFLAAESSPADVALIAHEAAHVAQQQTAPAARTTLMRDGSDFLPDVSVDDLIPDWILDGVRDEVRSIPGFTLLTYITGTDPLTGNAVDVSQEQLIEELLTYGPFGEAVAQVLGQIEVLGDIFAFVSESLEANGLTLARLQRDIDSAWEEFSVTNGIGGNVDIVERYVDALLRDVSSFVDSIVERVLEIVRSVVAGIAEPLLQTPEIAPYWNLAKKVLHYDVLLGVEVDAPTVEIIADFLRLLGEDARLAQMEERGTLQATADWVDVQLIAFVSLVLELGLLFSDAWAAIQPENLPDLFTNLQSLAERAFGLVVRVGDFVLTLLAKILELVKDSLLGWLSEVAHGVPGFHLLTVILEENPFTGEQVLRTAANLIRGFITLLPGGQAIYDQLAETGVISSAAERIEGAMESLGISVELITGIFTGIWDTLELDDLLDPPGAFARILDLFGEPLSRLVAFVVVVIEVVVTLILHLMNFPSELVGSVVSNTLQAIGDIRRDPVGFFLNMVEALKLGFTAFFDSIARYLLDGLVAWLFRGLGQLGITMPPDLSLASILDLVFQVLGLTAEHLWEKLGEHIGPERVAMIRGALDTLIGVWAFIQDVQTEGLPAIWRHASDILSGLWSSLLSMAMEWIMQTIVVNATVKLLSFLDPTGIMAVINGCVAFYNAVVSAIEYLHDMLVVLDMYVSTLAAVAAGNIAPGAQMIEQGLAAIIPIAIGFLAKQVGIGNIPDKIAEIIGTLRGLIDEALDWLIEQALRLGQAVLDAITGGAAEEPAAEPPAEPAVDPTDHEAVATQVVRELEAAPGGPQDYPALRNEKEALARTIEQRYAGTLGEGIRLSVVFPPATEDATDRDLDFEVVIAPNTTRRSGSAGTRERPNARLEAGVLIVNDTKRFTVDQRIQVARGGGWIREPRVIKGFEERTVEGASFIFVNFDTVPPGSAASVTAGTYGAQWREQIDSLVGLSDEELERENAGESWSSSQTAKWVLNYRAHAVQHVNPAGKDWEHVVEASTGGANSSDNLALADSTINNRLGSYYGTIRVQPELVLEGFTEPIALRDYLRGRSASVQRTWKLRVYAKPDFGLTLSWSGDAPRGRYQVLQ